MRAIAVLGATAACAIAVAGAAGASHLHASVHSPWIAYQANGIRLVHPDGSDDHRATARPAGSQEHPDWSPDGSMLVFDLDFTSLWTVDVATGKTRRLYRCQTPCYFIQDGAWSPDGRSIAFVRAEADASGENTARSSIVVLRVADGALRTVWSSPRRVDVVFAPRWSPNGARLVFELDRFVDARAATTEIRGARIGTIAASGAGGPSWLTGLGAVATMPDWNRKTGRIVFARGSRSIVDHPDDPSNLFTISPDGSRLRRLTNYRPPATRATQPTWTPDGKRILFTYVRGGGAGNPVYAFVAPNGRALALSPRSGTQTHPRLQP